MNTIICGDLHGKLDVAKALLDVYKEEKLVFIGDYVDSFTESVATQIALLRLLLDARRDSEQNVTVLAGNHELSYIDQKHRASGWNAAMSAHMLPLEPELRDLPKFLWVGRYLISHAGVSRKLLQTIEGEGKLTKMKEARHLREYLRGMKFDEIGYARGGASPVGGLMWCDWFEEFTPLTVANQVVGHSGTRRATGPQGIIELEGNYNVDCLDHTQEVLSITDEGIVEIIPL